jgi:hypothetical protein
MCALLQAARISQTRVLLSAKGTILNQSEVRLQVIDHLLFWHMSSAPGEMLQRPAKGSC